MNQKLKIKVNLKVHQKIFRYKAHLCWRMMKVKNQDLHLGWDRLKKQNLCHLLFLGHADNVLMRTIQLIQMNVKFA